jgi:hypothetical protein
MSVDSEEGVAVMSAQKMSAAKMGYAPCHQKHDKIMVEKTKSELANWGKA